VKEGDEVKKGQMLLVISAERTSSTKGDAQAAIVKQLESRHRSLGAELIKQGTILKSDEDALRLKIRDSKAEAAQLEREIATRRQRLALSAENLERYNALAKENIISVSDLHDHEEDHLDQRVQLETQERSLTSMRKDIASMENDLRTSPLKAANTLAAIERDMADIEQQTVDNEAHREIVVTAQSDGVVTAVLVEAGQIVTQTTPLLGVLPEGSSFEARLYVPSTAIGFIKVGNGVLLRYQAFPYQKFGQYSGKIREISRTALSASELQLVSNAQETLFRVTVALDSQTVTAYGERISLQDGMALEADVMVDTRKLWEWVLEPLYSLTGKY
jgi:membrane fusion protein